MCQSLRYRMCVLAALVALLFWSRTLSAGVTYSVVDDFSNATNNAESTWSYRYSDDVSRDGIYTLLSTNSDPQPLWSPETPFWHTGSGEFPLVGVNRSGGPVKIVPPNSSFEWPDQTVLMNPGSGGLAVVSWLSPLDGLIDIQFSFADLDPNGGDGIAWYVDLGDSTGELASGLFDNDGNSGVQDLAGIAVSQGDRVHFLISNRDSDKHDSTQLLVTITEVPEPASFGLVVVCSGLCMLCCGWRRRRLSRPT